MPIQEWYKAAEVQANLPEIWAKLAESNPSLQGAPPSMLALCTYLGLDRCGTVQCDAFSEDRFRVLLHGGKLPAIVDEFLGILSRLGIKQIEAW